MRAEFDCHQICTDCKEPKWRHEQVTLHGPRGGEYVKYHCPDPSLPDHSLDDDPWADDPTEDTPVAALFDPYD